MTEDVLVSVPSVLVWCCWVGGVMYLPRRVRGRVTSLHFLPSPSPRLDAPAPPCARIFWLRDVSGIYMYLPDLTCINRALFQSPNYIT